MAMNPLWCMVGGPIVAGFFAMLEKRDIFLSTATKIALAFVLTAIAFGILTFAVINISEDVIILPEIFLAIHFFQAIAEVTWAPWWWRLSYRLHQNTLRTSLSACSLWRLRSVASLARYSLLLSP